MGIIAENNQFYRGKKTIIDEILDTHQTMMSVIAGRNFSRPPGFLYESLITLEKTGKSKLSELNYQIVSEAIERELKQIDHDYTQVYKAARIAFELEKQTLLLALQQEFVDIDATQNLTEEVLNRQFVELDVRKIILVTTKTVINLQMEDLKRELIDLDRLTFVNEALLINEKINTATAKLTVIPYIEAMILAQEQVLIAEEANIPYMEDLIDEKELLTVKKEEVIPYLEDKSARLIVLAESIIEGIIIEKERLAVALSMANLKKDKVDNTLDLIAAEQVLESLRDLLYSTRHDFRLSKLNNQIALTDLNGTNIVEISTANTAMIEALGEFKVEIGDIIRDNKSVVLSANLLGNEGAIDISVNADKSAITSIATTQSDATKEKAEISAKAEITSKLIHLIGG